MLFVEGAKIDKEETKAGSALKIFLDLKSDILDMPSLDIIIQNLLASGQNDGVISLIDGIGIEYTIVYFSAYLSERNAETILSLINEKDAAQTLGMMLRLDVQTSDKVIKIISNMIGRRGTILDKLINIFLFMDSSDIANILWEMIRKDKIMVENSLIVISKMIDGNEEMLKK